MDIFCNFKNKFPDQIIEETKNFYLIHDSFPLVEGHLMIIPIRHVACFLNIKKEMREEFISLKNRAIDFLTHNYYSPKLFEHGGIVQTVPHAHLHLLPTLKSLLPTILPIAKIMKIPKIPYLYYVENKQEYYFLPKITVSPGFFHINFAKLLGRPQATERQKDAETWVNNVKRKFEQWEK